MVFGSFSLLNFLFGLLNIHCLTNSLCVFFLNEPTMFYFGVLFL